MIICMLWLVKQSTLTWLLLSFMFQWLLFKWGWGNEGWAKKSGPGQPGQHRFQFLEKFAISQKVSPPAQPSWTTWDEREGKWTQCGGCDHCVAFVSYLHYVLMNDIRVICVPVAAAWWPVTGRHILTLAPVSSDLSSHLTLSNSQPWHWPRCLPVCFVTLSANQRPVFGWADQSEARVSVFSSLLGPGARIMTKLFEQFSGVMSIMLILSAGHLLGILTQCVANNSFITIS